MILVDVNSIKFCYPMPWDKLIEDIDILWHGVAEARGDNWRDFIDSTLANMGGKNIAHTDYIEFESKCDALAFILKYGGTYEELDSLPADNE